MPDDGARLARPLTIIAMASASAMIVGVRTGLAEVVTWAAVAFAVAVAGVTTLAWRWTRLTPAAGRSVDADGGAPLQAYSRLAAIAYGWGAVAMQGMYATPLTGLKWQHGWQYALAMALLGVGAWYMAERLSLAPREGPPRSLGDAGIARHLTRAQAVIAAVGLAALVASGKLASVRADWAANRVFAALAVAILVISIAALTGPRARPHGGHEAR